MRAIRRGVILTFRRAHEARRDARLVFRAAAEGQPLELQRRLVLGKLAGGASTARITPTGHRVTPLEAATAGGHDDCVDLLLGAVADMEKVHEKTGATDLEQEEGGLYMHHVVSRHSDECGTTYHEKGGYGCTM